VSPLHIVIVDDHPLFRKGLKLILEGVEEIEKVVATDQFEKLQYLCQKEHINLILMDVDLGKQSGVEMTTKIKNLYPNIPVLAISSFEETSQIQDMVQAGVSGYIVKTLDLEELVTAVKLVSIGRPYFSAKVSKQLFYSNRKNANQKTQTIKLTIRELEILDFIIKEELGNKEIASRLYISPRTVETHKRNLLQKLQVKNIIGLTKYYYQNIEKVNALYGIPVVQNT